MESLFLILIASIPGCLIGTYLFRIMYKDTSKTKVFLLFYISQVILCLLMLKL